MIETIRKYIEAGLGAVSNSRAEQIAKGFAKQGSAGKDQVSKLAHEIAEWSKKNGERLVTIVRREVKKQILAMGVASKADIDALKKRVTALEGRSTSGARSGGTTKSTRPAGGRSTSAKATGGATGGAAAATPKKTTSRSTPRRSQPGT